MAYNNNYSNNNKKNNNNNRNNYNGKNLNEKGFNRGNTNNINSYVGAPYNFVPFNKKVIEVEADKIPVHDEVSEELLIGEIEYTVTAKTDIIVDDGNGKFHKDARDRYSIPGSTMRGLIRNNVQILGLSSFADDINDYRLMYRNVTGNKNLSEYNDILGINNNNPKLRGIARNVKAGIIVKVGNEYYIKKCKEIFYNGANYLSISAREIAKNPEKYPFFMDDNNYKTNFMYTNNVKFVKKISFKYDGIMYKYTDKEEKFMDLLSKNKYCIKVEWKGDKKSNNKKSNNKKNQTRFITTLDPQKQNEYVEYISNLNEKDITISYEVESGNMKNSLYEPYYKKAMYRLDSKGRIDQVVDYAPANLGKYTPCYVVSSGYMEKKKKIYIVPTTVEEKELVNDDTLRAFNVDLEGRRNTLRQYFKKSEEYKRKQEELNKLEKKLREKELNVFLDKKIDDFYGLTSDLVEKPVFFINNPEFNFGFTPRLRIFYRNSIKQGYKQDKCEFDYAKSIFGCINDTVGYKSKVSFSDAVLVSDGKLAGDVSPVLAGPKPTSYLDYINQSNGLATYNSNGFELRGVKQYWLHNDLQSIEKVENTKTASSFNPLKAGVKFAGKVRFQNLTKDELGLLVWSIKLNNNSWMNVGKAKAYGYGVVALSDIKVRTLDLTKAYSLDVDLTTDPMSEVNAEELIKIYKESVNAKLGVHKIDDLQSVKDFFAMKDSTCIPDNKNTRYMRLGDRNTDKEYQNRISKKIPLKNVKEVIGKK